MLKAIGQLPTYENVKCGEIFCVSSPPAVFNVTCILCDQKISLDKYALHFESQHLTLAEESYSLQDLVTNSRSCDVVEIKFEEDPPDDPIKEELSKGNLTEVPALQSICDREASDSEEFLDEDRSLLEIMQESKKSHEQKVTKKRRCDKLPKQEVNSSLETSSQLVELSISLAVDNANNELDISKNYSDDDGNGDDDNDHDDDDWLEKRDKKANTRTKAKTTEQRSCEICHRQYTSLKNYNKHMYYSHNIKLYSRKVNYKYHCDGCEKAFRTPRDLRAHTLKCNHNVKSDSNYGREAKREEVEEDNFNTTEEFQNSIDNEAVVQEDDENPLEMLNKNLENNKNEEEEEQSKPTAKTGKHTQQQQNELSCHICNRKYTTIKLHNKHMFAAHQIKILSRKVNYKHKCDECDQVFRIERDLRAHKVKHQKELENASSIITMLPNSEHKERKRGFRSAMSTTETVQMEVMGIAMPKDDGVANKQVHHNDNQSAVEDNDGAEEDTDWLDDSLVENEPNLEINDSKEVLSCRICRRTFKALKFLNKHMSLRHKIKVLSRKVNYKYKCDECEQMFRTQRDLKGHKVREHLGISCDICGKMFAQAGNMRRHRVRHSGIKAFKCKECPKEFYTSKELKSHTICHTGILPYICEICGRRCRDGGDLSAHMRRHTGERPAKCDVCGKRFFSVHDLNTHSVMHTTERPFSCEICGSRFQLKKTLRVHKLIHLPPQFSCNICDKTFVQSGHLRIHMRRHGNIQEKTNNNDESKNESNPEESYVPTVFGGSPDNIVNVMPNAQGV